MACFGGIYGSLCRGADLAEPFFFFFGRITYFVIVLCSLVPSFLSITISVNCLEMCANNEVTLIF